MLRYAKIAVNFESSLRTLEEIKQNFIKSPLKFGNLDKKLPNFDIIAKIMQRYAQFLNPRQILCKSFNIVLKFRKIQRKF